MLPPAHLPPQGSTLRERDWGQAYRLTEAPPGLELGGVGAPDPAVTLEAIEWLGVARYARWRRRGGTTFCNVYAHDLCGLIGAYLPRVWWTLDAIAALALGREVRAEYRATVHELSANALFRWFESFGESFGWRRVDLDGAQLAANAGRAAVIVAANREEARPGHISVVAPESPPFFRAVRNPGGRVLVPVQSQAGADNVELGASPRPGAWWRSASFPTFAAWAHGDADTPLPDTEPETPTGKSNPRMPAVDPGTGADDWRPATDARPFLETLTDDKETPKK